MGAAMNGQSDIHADSTTGCLVGRYASPLRCPKATTSPINRLEALWAWASLLVLIVCWDAALRLDERVSVPRVRIAHVADSERPALTGKWVDL